MVLHTSPMDPITAPTNVTPPNKLLSKASLKKKEVETKTSKRKKKLGLTRDASLQKREKIKKKKLQGCVTRQRDKVQRRAVRKKEKKFKGI